MRATFMKRQLRRVKRRLQMFARRDVKYPIGDRILIIPPEHYLPAYQEDFPLYDRYFLSFMRHYASQSPDLCVIDIGANVGDTTLALCNVAPDIKVIAVEGSHYFLEYLYANTRSRPNVQVVDAFVTHKPGSWRLISDGSTGHLTESQNDSSKSISGARRIDPKDILALARENSPRVWKTDTDGLDIPILLSAFDEITEACEIVWIEFDPVGNLSSVADVSELLHRIDKLDRDVVVFDNFGHLMLRIPAGGSSMVLSQLSDWFAIQECSGGRVVGYLDLWLLPSNLAEALCDSANPRA